MTDLGPGSLDEFPLHLQIMTPLSQCITFVLLILIRSVLIYLIITRWLMAYIPADMRQGLYRTSSHFCEGHSSYEKMDTFVNKLDTFNMYMFIQFIMLITYIYNYILLALYLYFTHQKG